MKHLDTTYQHPIHVLLEAQASTSQKGLEELHFQTTQQAPQAHSPTHNIARKRVNTSTAISAKVKPYRFLRLRLQRKPRLLLRFQRDRHAHVYVDKLFKEPAFSELVDKRRRQQKTSVTKLVIKPIADSSVVGGSKRSLFAATENDQCDGATSAADYMWESLGIASPQMDGIDRRAEEFIAEFRAEMKDQEKLVRWHM